MIALDRRTGNHTEAPTALSRLDEFELDRLIGDDCRAIEGALKARERALESVAGCEKSAVLTAYRLGGRLDEKKLRLQHGEWRPYLTRIGLNERSASSYLRLARQIGSASDLGPSIRATLATLPKPKPKLAAASDPENPKAVSGDVLTTDEAETAEADREARDERLAVRLADTDGDAVEVLGEKLDKANGRHRDDVQAVNAARAEAARERRKLADIRDALLAVTPSTCLAVVDDVLAKFFGVARKP